MTAEWLHARFSAKRGPIKPLLLDQRLLAGIGNIYAQEACWRAKLDPAAPAQSLSLAQVKRLLVAIRGALADGHVNAGRYHQGTRPIPFKVYDRDGEPCMRCGAPIIRITQSGRGTYLCPTCQHEGARSEGKRKSREGKGEGRAAKCEREGPSPQRLDLAPFLRPFPFPSLLAPSLPSFEQRPLQIPRLRNGDHLRMIHRLPRDLPQDHAPPAVSRRVAEHREELRLPDVI